MTRSYPATTPNRPLRNRLTLLLLLIALGITMHYGAPTPTAAADPVPPRSDIAVDAATMPPSVISSPASDITSTSATLHGSVNPNHTLAFFTFQYTTTSGN